MKIIKLRAENVKKLIAVEITPSGNVVKISGKNGSGKTSILDSIWYALGGTSSVPDKPIREGQKSAEIELELDEFIVKRRFTQKGSILKVLNKDGSVFNSPQSMLDSLVGKLSFDPLKFMRMEPRHQFSELKSIVNIPTDLDQLEVDRKNLVSCRSDLKATVKSLDSQIQEIHLPSDCPIIETPLEELMAKLEDGIKTNAQIEKAENAIKHFKNNITIKGQHLEELKLAVIEMEKEIDRLNQRLKEGNSYLETLNEVNIFDIQSEIKNISENLCLKASSIQLRQRKILQIVF